MSQHYSNPARQTDAYSLPDVETFTAAYDYCPECQSLVFSPKGRATTGKGNPWLGACHDCDDRIVQLRQFGWFWWSCFPGCLPDSEPMGPFDTEAEALADARDGMDDGDDEQ